MVLHSEHNLHENDLVPLIIGEAIYVHRKLGPGLFENTYKKCLNSRLKKAGLFVEMEKAIPLIFDDEKLDCGYRADFVINEKIILEIKSVDYLTATHVAQMLTYLRFGNKKLGLLINFNVLLLKDGLRRIVNKL